ncbi:MAG TPA: outer membrane protein assembly factor BamD [Pyrinomonadaceae bacterium]|jgi:outer membrane protein assembly factor BamD|nr:outer membrane protein assembly factor BamD [Pyrinomonadaceae bacterium]
MKSRLFILLAVFCALVFGLPNAGFAQKPSAQTELSTNERLNVMDSKLDLMRRSLSSAVKAMETKNTDKDKKANADDPVVRLKGLQKEVSSLTSEANDIRSKNDKAEKFDATALDRLEASVAELKTRVETGLQETAGARNSVATVASSDKKKKKKGKFFGLLGGGEDKYADLTGAAVAGRDRVLFEEATKEVRKSHYDTGRLLFANIINTYPDSPFLALAKLAIADSFFLEGTTSSLIQAAQAYQDWLTFFPTDPLADDASLKVAEAEMRQMGLSDRDISHARKAEMRLKVLLQTYPKSPLRPTVEARLHEVQENLAMHNLQIARFYYEVKFKTDKGGLKGSQSRLKEIVDKYPCFSYNDEVYFRLGVTYQQEEEPDEAAKYYQKLVQEYPESEFNEKAREQLNIIGAPIPEKSTPNPCSSKKQQSFMGNLMQQVSGKADVTINKNGILISKDGKEGTDLIDEALRYNGSLPELTTPDAPTQRTPAKTAVPAAADPKNKSANGNGASPAAAIKP